MNKTAALNTRLYRCLVPCFCAAMLVVAFTLGGCASSQQSTRQTGSYTGWQFSEREIAEINTPPLSGSSYIYWGNCNDGSPKGIAFAIVLTANAPLETGRVPSFKVHCAHFFWGNVAQDGEITAIDPVTHLPTGWRFTFKSNTVHLNILMHFSNSIRSLQTTFLGRS